MLQLESIQNWGKTKPLHSSSSQIQRTILQNPFLKMSEKSKIVPKRELNGEEDEDMRSIAAAFEKRKKSPINKGNATPKSQSTAKKVEKKLKKEESDEEFEKSSAKKTATKTDNKVVKKTKREVDVKKEVVEVKVKKEKKVYDLPGQKRDPPEERDPLRIFYESLHEQVPESEMAAIWMMECGLLPKEEAKKVFERKQKKTQQNKLGSPMKTVTTVKKIEKSVEVVKKSSTTPVSTQKKKIIDSKTTTSSSSILKKKTPDSKISTTQKKKIPDLKSQSKKRKIIESSEEDEDSSSEEDSDDDFVKPIKKQRAS